MSAVRRTSTKRGGTREEVYDVTVHEGPAAARAVDNPRQTFQRLCYRPKARIGTAYIDKVLQKSVEHQNSTFVMTVGTSGGGGKGPVALALCTLRGSMPGFRGTRLVFVDLVCSSKARRGTGGILLDELEAYARSLGARALVLQSVLSPDTRASYARRGFVRGVGNRSDAAVALARQRFRELAANPGDLNRLLDCADKECRALLATQLREAREDDPAARASPEFLQALEGEFYPLLNTLYDGGNSLVMFKPLPNASASSRRSGVVDWQHPYATFMDPRQTRLATYVSDPAQRRMRKLVVTQQRPGRLTSWLWWWRT